MTENEVSDALDNIEFQLAENHQAVINSIEASDNMNAEQFDALNERIGELQRETQNIGECVFNLRLVIDQEYRKDEVRRIFGERDRAIIHREVVPPSTEENLAAWEAGYAAAAMRLCRCSDAEADTCYAEWRKQVPMQDVLRADDKAETAIYAARFFR